MLKIQDVVKVIGLFRVTYPNAYKTNSDEEEEMLYNLWFDMFKEYPREVFLTAVKKSIANSEFVPKPATIMKEIEKMQGAYETSDSALWEELNRVLYDVSECVYKFNFSFVEQNGLTQGENARKKVDDIFESLNPALKEYCVNSRGLIAISQYNEEQMSYEKGRFLKTIPSIKEKIKTIQTMPDNIKRLFGETDNKIALPGEETK